MGARERVRRVLAAAAAIVEPGGALYAEALETLPQETGWPERDVRRALELCVEREASEDELGRLLASVPEERRVHVVLAGNVFVAAVRAVALAWASAPEILVKPSRRGKVFPRLLQRALASSPGEGHLTLVERLDVAPEDAVHAYGSDAALASLRAALPPGTRCWGHGHGFGVLAGDASLDLDALALDLNLLLQQGCLSPRLLFLIGEEDEIRALAGRIPALWSGPPPEPSAAVREYIDTLQAAGEIVQGPSFVLGLQGDPEGLLLPPSAGMLHVVQVSTVQRACELIEPWARWVTCLGGSGGLAEALARMLPAARRAAPGCMQRPPLDGPVDLRTSAPVPGYSRRP